MNEAYIPFYKNFILKKTTEISVNDVTTWIQSLEAGDFLLTKSKQPEWNSGSKVVLNSSTTQN